MAWRLTLENYSRTDQVFGVRCWVLRVASYRRLNRVAEREIMGQSAGFMRTPAGIGRSAANMLGQ